MPPAEENRTSAQWKGMRRRAIEGEEKEGGGEKGREKRGKAAREEEKEAERGSEND